MTRDPALLTAQRAFASGLCGDDRQPALALLRPLAGRAPLLDVYRHAYSARLTAALRDNHPLLHRVLGDESFAELARAYLLEHPSRRASIRWFGDALADFIAAQPDSWLPALADLARLEWALGLALDAADATPLTAAALAQVAADDWQTLPLAAHPSLRLCHMHWDVAPLWHSLSRDPDASTDAPSAREHALVVWRQDLQPQWRQVDDDESWLLDQLVQGCTVGQLCECAAQRVGDDAAPGHVAQQLHRWLADGMVT